jgi:hypothetical protein
MKRARSTRSVRPPRQASKIEESSDLELVERPSDPEPVEGSTAAQETSGVLSTAEKRHLLAQIVRLNPMDCLDESGAFDLARARRVLPACAVQHITIQETTRTDRQGHATVRRNIRVRLVNRLRAMRLDHALLKREGEDRAEARALAQREKLRAAQDAEIERRLQELKEENEQQKVETEIRAMKPEENRQEAKLPIKTKHAGTPHQPQDCPKDSVVPPLHPHPSHATLNHPPEAPPNSQPKTLNSHRPKTFADMGISVPEWMDQNTPYDPMHFIAQGLPKYV